MPNNFVPTGTTELSGVPQSFAPSEPIPVQAVDAGRTERLTAEMNLRNATVGETTGGGSGIDGSGLMGLLQGVVQKRLKQEKDDAMWDGMSRAAAGASVEELRAEQNPILTFLGEDAPAVLGAQMHHASTSVSKIVTGALSTMSDTATLTTEQAAAALRSQAQTALEGMDPGARHMAEQAMLEKFPALMQTHAKERVAYLNQQYINSSLDSASSAGEEFQATLALVPNGSVNSAGIQKAEQTLIEAFSLDIPGQTDKSIKATRAYALGQLLEKGHVNAYSRIRNSPLFSELDPEDQDKLIAKEDSATRKAAIENPLLGTPRGDFELEVSNLNMGIGYKTDAEIDASVAAVNAAHAASPMGGQGQLLNLTDALRMRQARDRGVQLRLQAEGSASKAPPAGQAFYAKVQGEEIDLSGFDANVLRQESQSYLNSIMQIKDPGARAAQLTKYNKVLAQIPAAVPVMYREQARAAYAKINNGGLITKDDLPFFQTVATLLEDKQYGIAALDNITDGKAAYWMGMTAVGVDFTNVNQVQAQSNMLHQNAYMPTTSQEYKDAKVWVDDNQSLWQKGLFGAGKFDNLAAGQQERVTREFAQELAVQRKSGFAMAEEDLIALTAHKVNERMTVMAGIAVEANPEVVKKSDQFKNHMSRRLGGAVDQEAFDEALKASWRLQLKKAYIKTDDPTIAVSPAVATDIGGGVVAITSVITRGPLAGRSSVQYIKAADVEATYRLQVANKAAAVRASAEAIVQQKQKAFPNAPTTGKRDPVTGLMFSQ